MESSIFICGMAPLDPCDPCYCIFQCDMSLDCDTHVEADFYVSEIERSRTEICCHCAGVCDSPIELNSSLKAPIGPYLVVLPICQACLDDGHNIIVRAARQNANAKQAKMQIDKARELAHDEVATAEIMKEMAAQSVGSGEANVAEPIVCSKKTQRKARYANFVNSHAHIQLFIARCDIVYVQIHRKTKALGGDPRPKRRKRNART